MDGYHDESREHGRFAVPSDRTGRRIVSLLFVVTGVTAAAAAAVIPVLLADESAQTLAQQEGGALAGLVACTVTWLWFALHRCLLRPAERLAADVHLLAAAGTGAVHVDPDDYPDLEPLPEAINALTDRLAATCQDVERANAESTGRLAEQNSRLSAILRDLHEGVLVCNLHHQVLHHNRAALVLLQVGEDDLSHGRTLFSLMLPEPVRHTLERLTRHVGNHAPGDEIEENAGHFVAGTPDGCILFDGRMSLIWQDGLAAGGGPSMGGRTVTGYVLTFTDATHELAALGQRDALLRAATEDLRAPLANLRAVMETLDHCPELEREARLRFETAMRDECDALTTRLEQISERYRTTITGNWPMSDLRSHTLIDLVRHRAASHRQVSIAPAGVPCRLHGDSYSLVLLLDHLTERVGGVTGATSFDLAAEAAARWTFLDLLWDGTPISSTVIDQWKEDPLPAALGGLTVADVLRHHRSDLWSDAVADGRARLRLPLLPALEAAGPRERPAMTPAIRDLSPLRQALDDRPLLTRRLDELNFVVFDAETTGTHPQDGDELVALAAIRVQGHRVLTDETFQSLVNPGRPIPPEATRCHGITDDHVRDRPDPGAVVSRFKSFVGDDVLVAHDAAFDLGFLRARERSGGVRFDNPVLDTRLLAETAFGRMADPSLIALARRLGIAAVDRHTPLGDSLVAAAVLVALLRQLRDRGMVTLADALRDANALIDTREREGLPR